MITPSEYIQDGKYMGAATLYGLSTDSKPTSYGNGSKFIEVDTGKTYYFDASGGEWYTDSTTTKTTTKKSSAK